jgi:hypothetical protein
LSKIPDKINVKKMTKSFELQSGNYQKLPEL